MKHLTALAITAMLISGGPAWAAEPGLLFHAAFDRTLDAFSAVGAGKPAGPVAGAAYEEGKVGRALVCGPQVPRVGYVLPGNLNPSAGTVALWVKPVNWTPGDASFHVFLEAGTDGGRLGWLLLYKYYQNGWLLLRVADERGRVGMATAEPRWQAGEWHHVAATWSAGALKVFVDGELAGEAEQPLVADTLGDTFLIGDNGWHGPNPGARTLLDDVRIYAQPLPPERIRRLAGRAGLQVTRHPVEGVWSCRVDGPGIADGSPVQVEVTREGEQQAVRRAEAKAAGEAAELKIPVADLAPGAYRVRASVTDAAGTVLAAGPAPMRKLANETVALVNGRLRLVFDGATGGLLGIEAPGRQLVARAGDDATPLLSLETVSFANHARFYPETAVRRVEPAGDGSSLAAMGVTRTAGGQRLRADYRFAPGIAARVTVDLPDESAVATFRLHLENRRPMRPSEALNVPRVTFPALSGLRMGGDAADDQLAGGRIQGEVIPNPAAILPRERALQYPGGTCVPWQDLYDASGGLTLAPLSDGTCQLEALSGARDGAVDLGSRWWALLKPGETWDSPPVELALHPGRWHWAAERFREWSLKHTPPRKPPAWLAGCDGWLGLGSATYTFRDLPKVLEAARHYGFFYLQLWSQMILGDNYYSYFYPNPDLGTEADLRRGIAGVHAAGGRIGFYSNVITFDGAVDANEALRKAAAQHRLAKLPRLPAFWDDFLGSVFVGPAGRYGRSGGAGSSGYPDTYWAMCPGAPGWQEYLAYWIARWQGYGCDTWYLDSFPVIGYGLESACFAEHHAHPRSLGAGQIGILARIRKGFRGGLLYEGPACAAFLPYANWVLGEEFAFGPNRYSRPEIFCYSFSDVHPVFAGSCNTWTGVANYLPEGVQARHEDAMNRVFLLGERFDTLGLYPLKKDDPFGRHVRRLVALRRKVRDVVYTGRFRDELGLSGMPEGAQARVFTRPAPAGAVVTVLDYRPQRDPWVLTIDTTALPWPAGLKRARILHLDGSESEVPLERDGGRWHLRLPPGSEVCAVRLDP